jgi:hypothetical protein
MRGEIAFEATLASGFEFPLFGVGTKSLDKIWAWNP